MFVGVLNTLITVSSYSILIYIGIHYFIANTAGYILGTLNSYFFNKSWVFQSKDSARDLFYKFIIVNIITLSISNILLFIFVDKLHYEKYLVQIIVIPITMLFNFTLNKVWTFKGRNIK
ncbi:GtrA family protein [Clostridium thermarum]|uniref:GtrA family protein n=1 Tax=Clostridium thermarum TaxID=1716543 RepID=UPI003C12B885